MKHFASSQFWQAFDGLPSEIQNLARKNFDLLESNPQHPSLHFKKIQATRYWSVRVGLSHRALAVTVPEGLQWFWIGTHADYDNLVS